MNIDRKNSGDDLREQKEKEREIDGGFGDQRNLTFKIIYDMKKQD